MRKFVILAATTLSVLAGAVASAEAMPMATSTTVAGQAPLVQVWGGCGPYAHPNPWGRCVPNRRMYGPRCVVRRDYYGRPVRVCRGY